MGSNIARKNQHIFFAKDFLCIEVSSSAPQLSNLVVVGFNSMHSSSRRKQKFKPRILRVLLRAALILLLILYCFSRNKAPHFRSCSDYSAEQKEKKEVGKVYLPPHGVEFWPINPGQSTLTIAIISNNRFASLKRLLNSLQTAEYSFEGSSLFSSIDIYFNLEFNTSTHILEYVLSFEWPHGRKLVRKRIQKGGLIRAVSESWYPSSENDFGLILEDDIEVSVLYLRWITKILWNLHFKPDLRVVGISLYSPKVTETTSERTPFNSTILVKRATGIPELPYLLQTPCSWGALYFPSYWSKFVQYMQLRLMEEEVVEIPNSRTNGWKASWKKYFFEILYIEGKFLLYPNFFLQKSFSTNHMEAGEHIKSFDDSHRSEDFTVPLLQDSEIVEKLKLERLAELPSFNLFGEPLGTVTSLKKYLGSLTMSLTTGTNIYPGYTFNSLDTLRLSGQMRSDRSDVLLSKYGSEYQCVMQADGNLVIYFSKAEISRKTENKNEETLKVVWSSGTFKNVDPCSAYVAQISMHGRLEILCEKSGIPVMKSVQSTVLWSSPWDRRGRSPDGYHLRLESTGALILYRGADSTCSSEKVVWKSDEHSRSRKIEHLPRCNADAEMDLQYECDNFPQNVANFLLDEKKITLMISFYSRYEILRSQIEYYSASSLIASIIVTWHNVNIKPPKTARVGNSFVYFVSPQTNSLNNRFNPDLRIYTACVLVIDDDMKIHLQDIYNLFEVWKRNKRRLVGFSPRWYDIILSKNRKSSLRYKVESEDPPLNTDGVRAKDGYGLMLTKSLMLHRDFLFVYSCGGQANGLNLTLSSSFNNLRRLIRSKVSMSLNCEDIGMNFIAAALLHDVEKYAPPLFVEPIHRIGDFGKLGKGSLHKKQGHETIRSECLNSFNEMFVKVTGGNLPLSRHIISSSAIDSMISSLQVEQYKGKRKRVHDDCFSFASGDVRSGCNFDVPHNMSYSVVWN